MINSNLKEVFDFFKITWNEFIESNEDSNLIKEYKDYKILKNTVFFEREFDYFINNYENSKFFDNIYKEFIDYIAEQKNEKFHKNKIAKIEFENWIYINDFFNKKFSYLNLENLFYKIFLYSSLKIILKQELGDLLKYQNNLKILSEDTPSKKKIKTGNTKQAIINEVINEMFKPLIIICNFYKIPISLDESYHVIFFFFEKLQEKKYIEIESKVSNFGFNKNPTTSTKYSIVRKNFIYDVGYLIKNLDVEFYKTPPLMIINTYLKSKNRIYHNQPLFVNESINQIKFIFSLDMSYGYYNNSGKNNSQKKKYVLQTFKDKDCLKKKIIDVKKNIKYYIKWNEFDEYYSLFFDKYFKNSLVPKSSSLRELMNYLLLNYSSYTEISSLDNKKEISYLLYLVYLKKFKEDFSDKDYVYCTFHYDFRGRNYLDGVISLTNFKLLRFLIYFGSYNSTELNAVINKSLKSKSFEILNNFKEDIKVDLNNIINEKYFEETLDKNFDCYKINMVKIFFISIGVIFKSHILKKNYKDEKSYSFDIQDIFDKGVEIHKKFLNNAGYFFDILDLEDFLKLKSLSERIVKFPDFYLKDPIGFDISCSGHQLRGLYFKLENLKNYEKINISNPIKGFDLYSFILYNFYHNLLKTLKQSKLKPQRVCLDKKKNKKNITHFFSSIEELDITFFKTLLRKFLKKSLMTTDYGCKFPTFIKYFEDSIKKSEEDYSFYLKNKNKVKILLILLYDFTKNFNQHPSFLLKNDLKFFYDWALVKKFNIKFFDEFETGLAFFDKLKYQKRITYRTKEKKRITMVLNSWNETHNISKTRDVLGIHLIHALDGAHVRYYQLILKDSFFSVHDEFWIPFQEVFLFKDDINLLIKRDMFNKAQDFYHNTNREFMETDCKKNALNEDIRDFYSFFIIM